MWVPIEAEVADVLELELEAAVGHPIRCRELNSSSLQKILSHTSSWSSLQPLGHMFCVLPWDTKHRNQAKPVAYH